MKYLTHFPKHKVELAKRLFKLFNEECFVSSLDPETPITWNVRLTKTAGLCAQKSRLANGQITRSSSIELSSKVISLLIMCNYIVNVIPVFALSRSSTLRTG